MSDFLKYSVSRFLPINTILLILASSVPQDFSLGPKLICSCTPWNTNLVSPWPSNDRIPLVLYRSAPSVPQDFS